MNANQIAESLAEFFRNTSDMSADELADAANEIADSVQAANTFDEAGIMTSNAGLVIRMNDGSEFQMTIVRSR